MLNTKTIEEINQVLETMPETLQLEALHYVEYLKSQYFQQKNQEESSADFIEQGNSKKRGGFGMWKGKIWMSEDFDAPLEEFEEYM